MIAARWASRRIISSVIALIMLDLKTALRVLVRLMMMQKLAMLLGQFLNRTLTNLASDLEPIRF